MSGYAAFLRGMNVGGHRISSAELRACFEVLGFRDVSSFRASGNVIFATPADPEPPTEMTARIEAGLEASLGYEVPVFLRTASEVRAIAASQPFPQPLIVASQGKLQVAMLSAQPSPQARQEVLALASDEDRLAFGDRELYWLPSGGILDSVLDFNKGVAKLLGPVTTRTKNTVEQVAAKYFAS
jgi:uncharacterized protein (DUF1697 family)